MPKVELIETSEPAAEESEMISQTAGSFLVSVAFWLSLLISAGMYASVALSPKLADWIKVRQQYLTNAARLKQLDEEVNYLERVANALKSDPEFARRLVKSHQNPQSIDAEFLPVSPELLFGGTSPTSEDIPAVVQPAVAEMVFHLASDRQHRSYLLAGAAGLTLLAFTLLNDAGVGIVRTLFGVLGSGLSAVAHRYRKPKSEPAEEQSAAGPTVGEEATNTGKR